MALHQSLREATDPSEQKKRLGRFLGANANQDTPDKQDPTQYKRAAVVAVGAMTVLATADDTVAARVLSENLARGAERMGDSQRKGLAYMADAKEAASLPNAYKEAVVAIRHQASIEKGVLRSASVLFSTAVPLSAITSLLPEASAS